MIRKLFIFTLILLPLCSCTLAKVDVNVVSERTSLENQVLGTYNTINDDLLLVASVRGISPSGKIAPAPERTPEQEGAVRALETVSFHADDVEAFKRLGWVGEGRDGLLAPFPRTQPKSGSSDQAFAETYSDGEFRQVLDEVNKAREVLMLRVIQTNENFTAQDLPEIRRVFARINQQNSPPGSKVQKDDGTWGAL
ncbi:MAG: DUF1318 domain-containing protein [Desulfuromonadales bacterium]|nr:DUF1318 domain-containing protein [Desulfuromonadales bacterium]